MDARILGRLAGGFTTLVALTFGLIVLGALVRAHEAGLACPDWPLCFGQAIPEMNLEVAFEWSHRVLAGSVALAFATLAGIAVAQPEARRRVGGWLALGTVLLLAQILLGALTVWQLLAAWTVTLHLRSTRRRHGDVRRAGPADRPRWAGRVHVRGPGVPRVAHLQRRGCNGGVWYPSLSGSVGLHLIHRTSGYLLVGLLLLAALSARQPRRLGRAVGAAFLLALAQAVVGIANVLLGLPVEVTGLHTALAAALVLTLAFALDEAWRRAPATIH
jgi:cytochrome c oxidase assembly protein subunit 15